MQAKNSRNEKKSAKSGESRAKPAGHDYFAGMKTPVIKPTVRQDTFFSPALRHLLFRTGRKQAEVSAQLGRKSNYLSQVKNGKRGTKIEDWARIASCFGLTIEQFVHLARLLNEGVDPDSAYKTVTYAAKIPSTSRLDDIFSEIKIYWLKNRGESPASILALSNRFPEIREWAERQRLGK